MNKQSFITILLTVLMSMTGIKVYAYREYDIVVANADGVLIYYDIIKNDAELAVCYAGDFMLDSEDRDYSNAYSGNINLPEFVEYNGKTYKLTSISGNAFYQCSGLTSITIPNSVTAIGSDAFYQCSGLTSITIPNSVTSIGISAFSGCSDLTSITIPNSVTSIGGAAFSGCSSLTSIKVESGNQTYDSRNNCNAIIERSTNTLIAGCKNTIIPSSVTTIAGSAFSGSSNLKAITIPNSVTSIGYGAFSGCNSLTSVTIPNSVKTIDSYSFSGCNSLTSVTIPNSVISIGGSAFQNCISLSSVVIPNSVTYIGSSAFEGSRITEVRIPSSMTEVGDRAFYGCQDLTSVIIPNCVTSIEYGAFMGCSSLQYISIPNSVTSIGRYAFNGCGLTSVSIPNSVLSIGEGAFSYCRNLSSVEMPNSLVKIERSAFFNTSWYEKQSNGLIYLGKMVVGYKGSMPQNTNIVIKEGTLGIADYAFSECKGLSKVTIPTSMTYIGQSSFWYCSNLESVNIPDNVTYIGRDAFNLCENMTTLTIGKGITSIEYATFQNCRKLTSVTISNSVTSIGWDAFSLCRSLTSITIPNSVTSIGWYAFSNCSALTSVTIPNSVTSIGLYAFSGTPWYDSQPNGLIYVGKVAYKYKGIMPENTHITIKDGTSEISGYAFSGCSGLTSITIPNSVTSISYNAFENCSGLNSITFPNSVFSIYGHAFDGTSWYENQTDGVIYTGKMAYKYKGEMPANTHIEIKDGTLGINLSAFYGCSRLTSVAIPNSVTSIGESAFYGCSGLTSVAIPNSVTFIGDGAFVGSGLTSVIIGKGVTSIGNIFNNCYSLKEIILHETTYENGIPTIPERVTEFTTYSKNPMRVMVKSKGATSATMNIYPISDRGNTNEDNYYTVTMHGLTPGQYIKWKLDDENYGIVSEKTSALTLTTQPAQPTSTTKARLSAIVNDADDDLHFGFEWLRNDAPSNMPANKVSAPLYEGKIIGSLSGLNPDIYYKYRPYYQSDNGETYYGEWVAFLTGDANVFFEPESHTKEASEVTGVSAQLAGVWIEGTEDIEEKGFEYWTISKANTRAAGSDVKTIIVSGKQSTITIEGLVAGKEYGYRTYVKTASGTTYGEEKTFKTVLMGDANEDGEVNDADVDAVASHIMGQSPTGFSKKNADMNGDKKIDVVDIVLMQNKINKK